MKITEYIEINKNLILNQLFDLLRIKSVSAHHDKNDEIKKCAQKWQEILTTAGADKSEIFNTNGNPVVFAEKIINETAPTILIYGHYDVMPAEPLEKWNTDPFEPIIVNDKIYARGADDDKGQSFMHLIAFEYLVKYNLLKYNVKFLLEGEEEIGSPSLEAFCEANKSLLKCDTILVSDTSMLGEHLPSITTGLRGLAYWQIEVTGASHDLHSGIFGGAVANPANELTKILAKLTNEKGEITIPGFYDNVELVSSEEKHLISLIPFDEDEYKQNLGISYTFGETGYSTIERTGIRPALDICGIWSGYIGEGSKTVLPSKAYAKLSARLVPNQTYKEISDKVIKYINDITPKHVNIRITPMHGTESYVCPIDLQAYKAAEKAYERTFNKRPVPVRRGGSIGVIPVFEKILGVKSILMGFGLESDAIHSPNENFPLAMFFKGIETIVYFHEEFSSDIQMK